MYLRSVGKYLFVFPAEVIKEVKDVEKVVFPYSVLVFVPYIVLYVYLSMHLTLGQALLMFCVAAMFVLLELEEERSPWKAFFLSLVGGAFFTVSLDYFYAYVYGIFGGFLFSREVYINKEWNVYVRL